MPDASTLPASAVRILHVTAPAAVGGLEGVVQALARGHRARGHDVNVAAIVASEGEAEGFLAALRDADVRVFRVIVPGRSYLRELAAIRTLCKQVAPDVVHTHGYRSDILGGSAARRARVPTVSTVHGFTGGGWKMQVYEHLQQRALSRADAVVAVSEQMVGRLTAHHVSRERIHVLPNAFPGGADLLSRASARRALGVPADAFHIGWVGRLGHEKGADVLLRALAQDTSATVTASIIGDGAERRALEALATSLGVADRIRWHGILPGASRYYQAFDALVLSSRTEGTPLVLLEAMAAGIPVVATRVGGVPAVVNEMEALLVESEDHVALAQAVDRVRADVHGNRTRAAAAKARLRDAFDPEPWLERYLTVYEAARRVAGRIV